MYGDDHFLLHTFKDHIGLLNYIKFKGSLSDATKLMPELNPMHPDEILSLVPYGFFLILLIILTKLYLFKKRVSNFFIS